MEIFSFAYLLMATLFISLPLLILFFLLIVNKYLNYGKISDMLKLTILMGLAAIYVGS